jgi:tRNA modification GTPase
MVDTAGLREGGDRIEAMGIEVSRRYLGAADVVLYCVEPGADVVGEFVRGVEAPVLVVRTKVDGAGSRVRGAGEIAVSSVTGAGLPELRRRLAELAFQGLVAGGDPGPMITRARHRQGIETALAEIRAFGEARENGLDAAVAATHLRTAVGALEDVIGVVTPEDMLNRLFAGFCVGK